MADIAIKVISVTVATRVSNAERGALSTAFAMITDWVVPSGRAGRPRILASWWRWIFALTIQLGECRLEASLPLHRHDSAAILAGRRGVDTKRWSRRGWRAARRPNYSTIVTSWEGQSKVNPMLGCPCVGLGSLRCRTLRSMATLCTLAARWSRQC